MEPREMMTSLDQQGRLLVDAAEAAGLEAAVPSCRGWSVADLLTHIGLVHRWAAAVVDAAGPEIDQDLFDAGVPVPDDDLADWARDGHADLVRALREAPESYVGWTLLPSTSTTRDSWIRRELHETAVHRMDAELAAGRPLSGLGSEVAADGIDELLILLVPFSPIRPHEPTTIAVVPSDADIAWCVRLSQDPPITVREDGPGDLTLRGTADDLFALLENRSDDGVAIDGDAGLLGAWRRQVRISR
jgi:uncharacterized protein (TIGR03083 family)